MKMGLVTLILSVAALIGLAYNQHLYRKAIMKINELDKKISVKGLGNKQSLTYRLNNPISEQVLITRKPAFSSDLQSVANTAAQKTQQGTQETDKFYSMFKDAMTQYEKEVVARQRAEGKQRHMKSRLNRYKKRLKINDTQWQFVEPVLTEYLKKLDEMRQEVLYDPADEDYEACRETLIEKQEILRNEYAGKLSPYLMGEQIDDFRQILIW